MRRPKLRRFFSRHALVAALVSALTSCGGGGGDGGGPLGTIDLTVANRDTVAHAVVAGAMGIGGADAFVSSSGLTATSHRFALVVRDRRVRPLLVSPPSIRQCSVSGVETTTEDDRDNSGGPTVGDVITIVYNQCIDNPGETWHGTSVATLTQLDANALGFRMESSALSTVRDGHSTTLNGAMQALLTAPSANVLKIRLTADGAVTAAVTTPIFADTVTLQSGFVQEEDIDTNSLASTTTVGGQVHSASAAGQVTVSTEVGFLSHSSDDYPRSGVARISGRTGVIKLTSLGAIGAPAVPSARLDLDAGGDGTYEDTATVRWDWLI